MSYVYIHMFEPYAYHATLSINARVKMIKYLDFLNRHLETCQKSENDTITRDRCYDFLNVFAESFGEKNGIFDLKQS
jgi:hypothetical protein